MLRDRTDVPAPEEAPTVRRDDGSADAETDAEAYLAALATYVQDVPPRSVVPSEREVEVGGVDYDFKPAPPPPKEPKVGVRKQFLRDLKLLDPRGIATKDTLFPLIALTAIATVGSFDNMVFRSLLTQYIRIDMDFDEQVLLRIVSVMGIMTTLTAPIAGFVADRVSRVQMVRFGALVDNLSSFATALAPTPMVLGLSRVSAEAGGAVTAPAVAPLLADYFPVEKRARVAGFQTMVSLVWVVISVFALMYGVTLTGAFTWRQFLMGAAVVATLVSLLAFWVKEPVRGAVDRKSLGASGEQAAKAPPPVGWTEAWRICGSINTLRKVWYAAPFLEIAQVGAQVFVSVAVQQRLLERAQPLPGAQRTWIQAILSNPTVVQVTPLLMLVLPMVVQMMLTPYAASFANRLLRSNPARIMVYVGAMMIALSAMSLGAMVVPEPLMMLPISLVVGALAGLVLPSQGLLLSVVLPARVRGQGFQTVMPFRLLGYLGVGILSVVSAQIGPIGTAFLLLPLTAIGAFFLISAAPGVKRDIANAVAASIADQETHAARARGRSKLLVMRDIDVNFDSAQVLFGVDFDVEEGQLVALLGTNGAGKSTLLRAIAGLHEISAGAIFLDGEDISHKPPHLNARDGIVFLPGGRAIFPTLDVAENLRAAAWLYREDESYVQERTEVVLELFPVLRERLNQNAGDLSGGEQQMLALGQAFLMKPRLLMIDELSLGLAPRVVEKLLETVRAIHAEGTTVILVEQSLSVAMEIAERAVFMEKGEIRFDGPTSELLARGDLVRAVFLGSMGGGAVVRPGQRKRTAYGEAPARVLAVEEATVRYGGVVAIDRVSLEVHAAEVVGVLGPNGAGKTTLFDAISGFAETFEGALFIGATDATRLSPDARARLGLARSFQDTRLFPSLTVRETIAVAMYRRLGAPNPVAAAAWTPGSRRRERHVGRRVQNLIELLNLDVHAEKFVSELSTGMRRMVDIACVMAAEPTILLLDEPSSGLAHGEVEIMGPIIQRLGRETGCGILVIEHHMPLLTSMSDRLVAMDLGRVVATGEPDAVMRDPEVMRAYVASSGGGPQQSLGRSFAELHAAPVAHADAQQQGDLR